MSEVHLKALVLLPGEVSPFDRVHQVIADCLDLADFEAVPIDYTQEPDALWAATDAAVAECRVVLADFSHICESCTGPDYDIVVAASLARFKFGLPVLVCHHGPVGDAMPLGWHAHADTFAYTPDDDGFAGLRKSLNRRLMEIAQSPAPAPLNVSPSAPTSSVAPTAAASDSMTDSAASTEGEGAGGADADREDRLKQLFRERFRQSLGGSEPATAAESATGEPVSQRPASGLNLSDPSTPGAAAAQAAKAKAAAGTPISLKKADPEAEAKRARMLELQEKLRRKEEDDRAAALAAASSTASANDDDLGFDLNIDLGGDAPAIVTGKKLGPQAGSTDDQSAVKPAARAGRPVSSASSPPPMSDDSLVFGEDDDDEEDIDLDDIDILAEIKREQAREKKKKKVKKIARPRSQVPASSELKEPDVPRNGMGALFDKRTGRSLVLRKSPVTIGRVARGNDLIIAEPQISTSHAKITRESDGYYIEDLTSTNGTFVNDERIIVRTHLKHGDRIVLAKTADFPLGVREYTFTQDA